MSTTAKTTAEAFGLIAVEEYGGKVRLWPEEELLPWICQEVSVGGSLGRSDDEIKIHIVSRWGKAGLRLYLKHCQTC
jgi:hypothetical protein